jgi:SAM-dependent methyltransferase
VYCARVSELRAGEDYRPPEYWDDLHETADLRAVGYPTLPLVYNRYLYENVARAVLRDLHRARVEIRGRDVLDVGSGTGYWIDLWQREGAASVAGADLVPAAVERLRARLPAAVSVVAADIGEGPPYPDRTFDVVTIMSVLHHVVDEDRFRTALANLASQLRPDGRLVVLDPLVVRGRWGPPPGAHNTLRTRATWDAAAGSAGLRLLSVQPAGAWFAEPVDAGSRAAFAAHRLWWRAFAVTLRGRDRLANVVVPPLAALDRWVTPRLRSSGPSGKLLVLGRVD